jgi:hypothetical protein
LIFFLPQMRLVPLGGFKLFPIWVDISRQLVGILWPLCITVLGIIRSEGLTWVQSTFVTLIAFLPTAVLMMLFIR